MSEELLIKMLTNQYYLLYIIEIMIIAGLVKRYGMLDDLYMTLVVKIKSKRIVVILMSLFGGVLPIPGRVVVSGGMLSTIATDKAEGRVKFGIVDYLATHHYYLWSPLEKTVILPMAILSISYSTLFVTMLPILTVFLILTGFYIFIVLKEEDIDIRIDEDAYYGWITLVKLIPFIIAVSCIAVGYNVAIVFGVLLAITVGFSNESPSFKMIKDFVDWKTIVLIGMIISLGIFAKAHTEDIYEFIKATSITMDTMYGVIAISSIGFLGSFLLGSSSRFAAITSMLTLVYGLEYLLWFFVIDFVAYLVSPTHKCLVIGAGYFKTPIKMYYGTIVPICLLMLITAGLITFT